jgi:uncharacterized membrane protein YciS (DUF1049 family)
VFFSVIIHLAILLIKVPFNKNLSSINYFNIIDFEKIYPTLNITSMSSFIISWIFAALVYIIIFILILKKSKKLI